MKTIAKTAAGSGLLGAVLGVVYGITNDAEAVTIATIAFHTMVAVGFVGGWLAATAMIPKMFREDHGGPVPNPTTGEAGDPTTS